MVAGANVKWKNGARGILRLVGTVGTATLGDDVRTWKCGDEGSAFGYCALKRAGLTAYTMMVLSLFILTGCGHLRR